MPDVNGWHVLPVIYRTTGEEFVWHHCKGADADSLIRNTPQAKKQHQRECFGRQRADEKRRAKLAQKRRLEVLALARSARTAA